MGVISSACGVWVEAQQCSCQCSFCALTPAPLGAGLAAAASVAHTVGHHCSPSVRSVVPVLSLGDGACSFITGICRCAEGKEERRG